MLLSGRGKGIDMRVSIRTLVIAFLTAAPVQAVVITVPGDAPTIQAAIDAASDGDSVLVDTGTYAENISFEGKNIVVGSLFLATGDEALIAETIIDGGAQGSVVEFLSGEDRSAVLAGFTVTNGDADYGGGIACGASAPTLSHLIVRDNHATGGGGIHCHNGAAPLIEHVTVSSNSTIGSGSGGGIRCSGHASPELRDVRVEGNTALHGGGVYCYFYSHATLTDVVIVGNVADSTTPSSPSGGGFYCGGFSNPRLERVLLAGNRAGSEEQNLSGRGGAVYCSGGSTPVVVHATISDNTATFAGGGLYCLGDAFPHFVNSILWDDVPQEIVFDGAFGPDSVLVAFSDVEGGQQGIVQNGNGQIFWLEGNISEDPLFVAADDFQLQEDSPCIDAGTDLFIADGDTLVQSDPEEYSGEAPDMGAFEFTAAAGVGRDASAWEGFVLYPNHPNPFRTTTRIEFAVSGGRGPLDVRVYDAAGRLVRVLETGSAAEGRHGVAWDGMTETGRRAPAGVYLYRLRWEGGAATKRLVLLR